MYLKEQKEASMRPGPLYLLYMGIQMFTEQRNVITNSLKADFTEARR
jgi:threonine/homoserine/homoserine lactone efflux protein